MFKNKKPMKEELLKKVSGGVEVGIPSGKENLKEYNEAELNRRWDVIKQRMEWKFKTKEQEMQAKKLWIDAGLDLAKKILPSGETVTDVIKKMIGGGGSNPPAP